MKPSAERVRLTELVGLLCDDLLNDAQFTELENLLAGSSAASKLYHELIATHLQIEQTGAARFDALMAETAAKHELALIPDAPPTGDVELATSSRTLWTGMKSRLNNPWAVSALLSGLFVTGMLLTLALWTLPEWRGAPPPGEHTRPVFVARIARTHDAQWSAASQVASRADADLFAGQSLDLLSGWAEIQFDSGAVVLLKGPSRFVPRTPLAGTLQQGELTCSAPPSAKGFSIVTPTSIIVDLGTEFGVAAPSPQETYVEVFVGEVEISANQASTGRNAQSTPQRLTAGGRVAVDMDGRFGAPGVDAVPTFVRQLPQPSLVLGVDFASTTFDKRTGHEVQRDFQPFVRDTDGSTASPQSETYDEVAGDFGPVSVTVACAGGRLVWRDRGDLPDWPLGDLVEDFVTTNGLPLELTIAGLPSGRYTLATYHHDMERLHGTLEVRVTDGRGVDRLAVKSVSMTSVGASAPARSVFEVETVAEEPLQVKFAPVDTPHIVLNGFALLKFDPPAQAVAAAAKPTTP